MAEHNGCFIVDCQDICQQIPSNVVIWGELRQNDIGMLRDRVMVFNQVWSSDQKL